MDVIKDHLISHISNKKTINEMFYALGILYQSENINIQMIFAKQTSLHRDDHIKFSY
jgi:hypothetical protein